MVQPRTGLDVRCLRSQLVEQEPLFYEQGASWYWLLAGPISGITMLLIQMKGGGGIQLFVPTVFLVLVTGFLWLQVHAARIHTTVVLTAESLRQGTEVIPVRTIVAVYPEAEHTAKSATKSGELLEKWQTSRALGRAERHSPRTQGGRYRAHRGPHRAGLGTQASPAARGADPGGRGARRPVRHIVQLVLATLALVGAVLSWLQVRSIVDVSPIADGQPATTSVAYSPPMMVLTMLLATTAGVLIVLGVAGLIRGRRPGAVGLPSI